MKHLLYVTTPTKGEWLYGSYPSLAEAERMAAHFRMLSPRVVSAASAVKLLSAVKAAVPAPRGKDRADGLPSYGRRPTDILLPATPPTPRPLPNLRTDGRPFGADPLPATPPPIDLSAIDYSKWGDAKYMSDFELTNEVVARTGEIVVVEGRLAEIRVGDDGFYLTFESQQRAEFLRAKSVRLTARVDELEGERERRRQERASSAARLGQLRRAGVQ